jgi:protein scribble
MKVKKLDNEKLGMVVKGGVHSQPGNPFDQSDEGIFISKITKGGCASKYEDLKVGQRIIEVNGESLLGASHQEAVDALRNVEGIMEVQNSMCFVSSNSYP